MKRTGPFFAAVRRFIEYLRSQRHVSDRTVVAYESDLEEFGGYLVEELARDRLGEGWQQKAVERISAAGIERVLL